MPDPEYDDLLPGFRSEPPQETEGSSFISVDSPPRPAFIESFEGLDSEQADEDDDDLLLWFGSETTWSSFIALDSPPRPAGVDPFEGLASEPAMLSSARDSFTLDWGDPGPLRPTQELAYVASSIEEFEEFACGGSHAAGVDAGVEDSVEDLEADDLDRIFGTRGISRAARQRPPAPDIPLPQTKLDFDDWSSLFVSPSTSREKGKAGQIPETKTNTSFSSEIPRGCSRGVASAKAVADKKQRDLHVLLHALLQQAEKDRVSESLNAEIKRWTAGKEGHLRALLSTLQCVLWPQCGWQPVSLTDLNTPASVKKVYRKAILCVHPDKVQPKGATFEQSYIAEKVFDILKEAWDKFKE